MKNRINLLCVVSIFVAIGLSACDFNLHIFDDSECDPSKKYMWCEDDKLMMCNDGDHGGIYYYTIEKKDTCASGQCVEFQWPGHWQEAACLIRDQQCPELGVQYSCDGNQQVTCTPTGGVVSRNDCVIYGLYDWALNADDHFEDFEPTCVVLGWDHTTTCALSKEPCNSSDSKCVNSAFGRSIPISCDGGFWNYDEYDCETGLRYEDFPWICAFSVEKGRNICAFSTDECTDSETRCAVSPTTGEKVLEICYDGLWSYGKLCIDCINKADGTNTCVE